MLTAAEVAMLNWHPLRTAGRVENYALAVMPPVKASPCDGNGPKNANRVRYLLACGHVSEPSTTRCERLCTTAPAYAQPLLRNRTLEAFERWNQRTGARSPVERIAPLARAHGWRYVPRRVA